VYYVYSLYVIYKQNKEIEARLENRVLFALHFPSQLGRYAKVKQEFFAKQFCQKWIPHRAWLKQNNFDFSQYPEELEYQQYKNLFQFRERGEKIRLLKA
jgi:hypothetical protein